jgi:two-component system chemotaxis sensor kinase CheA
MSDVRQPIITTRDVVKNNIEKIGGTVDVSSVPSLGTTVRMKIPLTLAIIPR